MIGGGSWGRTSSSLRCLLETRLRPGLGPVFCLLNATGPFTFSIALVASNTRRTSSRTPSRGRRRLLHCPCLICRIGPAKGGARPDTSSESDGTELGSEAPSPTAAGVRFSEGAGLPVVGQKTPRSPAPQRLEPNRAWLAVEHRRQRRGRGAVSFGCTQMLAYPRDVANPNGSPSWSVRYTRMRSSTVTPRPAESGS
jgi:hypothetical protein